MKQTLTPVRDSTPEHLFNSGAIAKFRSARLLFSTLLFAASAQASVIYDFSGTGSLFGVVESFHYTAPDFITDDSFVSASSFDQCSTGQTEPCFGANFLGSGPDTAQRYPELTFQSKNPNSSVGTAFYYFPTGSNFAAYGRLTTIIGNPGTLTISAVPEPSTALIGLIATMILVIVLSMTRTGEAGSHGAFSSPNLRRSDFRPPDKLLDAKINEHS